VPHGPVEDVIAEGGSALLIGDRALQAAGRLPAGIKVYDLGELWWRFTGLPFVFGLWIVRKEAYLAMRDEILAFRRQLDQSLALAFADLAGMAAAVAPSGPLGPKALENYWRTVSYAMTPAHLDGLCRFFALCVKHGLLPEEPEIHFTA
jgi:chorismate dehydratase